MEFLSSSGQIMRLDGKIGHALKALVEQLGTRQKAVKALKEYLLDPSGSEVAKILEEFKIDDKTFEKFVEENNTALAVLLGTVGDLAEHELSWDLSKQKKVGKNDW